MVCVIDILLEYLMLKTFHSLFPENEMNHVPLMNLVFGIHLYTFLILFSEMIFWYHEM